VKCSSPRCTICRESEPDGPCFRVAPFLTACGRRMRDGTVQRDEHGRPIKVEPTVYTYDPARVGCPRCLEAM